MSPFLSTDSVLGLDIGYESLKLVELKNRNKNASIRGAIDFPLTERILAKQSFHNKEATAKLIREACAKAKPSPITAKKIVSALPESFVFSKTIQLPRMNEREYAQAVTNEASQYLPIPVDDVYIDFEVLIAHPDKPLVDILLVAAPKRLVDDYVELAKIAGMELIALETKPLAAGRALIPGNQKNSQLIAEIGTEITRISIWDHQKLRLVTTVNVGHNQIAGLDQAGNAANNLSTIGPITEEIINAIKYHQNRDYSPTTVETIYVCGQGAKTSGIDQYISQNTKLKAVIATPALSGKIKLGPEFVTAFGLALRKE